MSNRYFSIRQKKLLQILQNQTTHITGAKLAEHLQVSPRTVRNDIASIHDILSGTGVVIDSYKSKGYLIIDTDHQLDAMLHSEDSFQSREERVYYLAFQLCLSEVQVDLYDLEEELHISRSTLEHDLMALTEHYVHSYPHITLHETTTHIAFEKDERKRRAVLNRLVHEDWNYNAKGNSLFGYQYLDEDQMAIIMNATTRILGQFHIQLEDANSVLLNLAIAIMQVRIQTGHVLNSERVIDDKEPKIALAVDALFDFLEDELSCNFCPAERDEVYLHIANCRLLDASLLSFSTVEVHFSSDVIDITDQYLKDVWGLFKIDLRNDEDFYITLLQYVRYLKSPMHIFNAFQINPKMARSTLKTEYEIAYLFQPYAIRLTGSMLDAAELLHLAMCVSGAMEFLYKHQDQQKMKAVILCHLNLYATWALKRKILASFDSFIDVVALLPVNAKATHEFNDVDIVLTTVNKPITDSPDVDVIHISPLMTQEDYLKVVRVIDKRRIDKISQLKASSAIRTFLGD